MYMWTRKFSYIVNNRSLSDTWRVLQQSYLMLNQIQWCIFFLPETLHDVKHYFPRWHFKKEIISICYCFKSYYHFLQSEIYTHDEILAMIMYRYVLLFVVCTFTNLESDNTSLERHFQAKNNIFSYLFCTRTKDFLQYQVEPFLFIMRFLCYLIRNWNYFIILFSFYVCFIFKIFVKKLWNVEVPLCYISISWVFK